MKKIILSIACITFLMLFCVTVNAAGGTVTIDGGGSVTTGSNIELIASLSGCADVTSASVNVRYGDGFEFVSGQWLKTGSLATFDKNTQLGAIGGLSSPDINGGLFKLTLRAKATSAEAQSVQITVTAKNGQSEVFNMVATKAVQITCASHNFGDWTITKQPTCTTAGTKTRTCTVCKQVESANIAATGHSFSNPMVTKEPTCTENGIESGVCTRCGQTTTSTIKAKGHKFGKWSESKAPTCEAGGTEARKCSECGAAETRNTKALGHDFEELAVVKEPTLTSFGLMEGKCKRCNEVKSEKLPYFAKDEGTGIEFRPHERAFPDGTLMKVEELKGASPIYENIRTALQEISKKFVAYDIAALSNEAKVQPNATVGITLNIPDGFGTNVALYILADDGKFTQLEATVDSNRSVVAEATILGSFVIADLDAGVDRETETDEDSEPDMDNDSNMESDKNTDSETESDISTSNSTEKDNDSILSIIICVVLLIVVAGTLAFVIAKKGVWGKKY